MPLVSHGIPVVSSRQWTYALSPNATADGWNFITSSYNLHSLNPVEWVVVKDLTGTPAPPSQAIFDTPSGFYANSNFNIANQLRAPNGRIFFGVFQNYVAYYDPTTESVAQLGPIAEVPPVPAHASTIPFSACFDQGGLLYFATQESVNRPSMVFSIDPATLTITVLGYVGSGALAYTTYGYHIVADTITAAKYAYVGYGEDPWQLWGLNLQTGVATMLFQPAAGGTGQVTFQKQPEGWVANCDSDIGKPDNVRTQLWCIDGVTYPFTTPYNPLTLPFTPRSVTPASNPLVTPPGIDATGGIGIVGWRPNGSVGPYDYVNYTVVYSDPQEIESLTPTSDGVLGNAVQYQGFFRYVEPADTHTWFGAFQVVSEGPRLSVPGVGIFICGYPNGVLLNYDETLSWQTGTNPKPLGNYAASGMKYAGVLAWSPTAGASGRLYCVGSRDRDGVGSGIGYWDQTTKLFGGTFAGLSTVLPTGLAAMDSLGQIVMATRLITPPGTAPLYTFDHNLNPLATLTVLPGVSSLGQIYTTADPNVICGVVQGSGNSLGLYHFNVNTATLVTYVELPIIGVLGTADVRRVDGSLWKMSGNNLVRIDPDALTAAVITDLTAIAPIIKMGFGGDGHTLFFAGAGAAGVDGAQVWSEDVGGLVTVEPATGIGATQNITLIFNGNITIVVDSATGVGVGSPVDTGLGGTISIGTPVYSSADGHCNKAIATSATLSQVVGLVADQAIAHAAAGNVRTEGPLTATSVQWDAITGDIGGLVPNAQYYLDPSTAGMLTRVQPTDPGQFIAPIGTAISSDTIVIRIKKTTALF